MESRNRVKARITTNFVIEMHDDLIATKVYHNALFRELAKV